MKPPDEYRKEFAFGRCESHGIVPGSSIHCGKCLTELFAACQREAVEAAHGNLDALLSVAEAAERMDAEIKRMDDGDFSLDHEFAYDNAWEQLRNALARLRGDGKGTGE